jgi:hypothetical protein
LAREDARNTRAGLPHACRTFSGFADQEILRLAARGIGRLDRHEVVEQDHVGGLQRAPRAASVTSSDDIWVGTRAQIADHVLTRNAA